MGFDKTQLVESLHNRIQNEVLPIKLKLTILNLFLGELNFSYLG